MYCIYEIFSNILVGKPESNRSVGNAWRWENIIKMCFKQIGFYSVNFIYMWQNRVQWYSLVYMMINPQVLQKVELSASQQWLCSVGLVGCFCWLVGCIFCLVSSLVYIPTRSRVSSGSIVSDYGLDDRAIGVPSPTGAKDFSCNLCVQTGSGAHPASCTMGTGGPFPGVKSAAGAWRWPLIPI
jgi:hypothetical protein